MLFLMGPMGPGGQGYSIVFFYKKIEFKMKYGVEIYEMSSLKIIYSIF